MASTSVERSSRTAVTRGSAFFFRHPRLKLGGLLSGPLAWMVLIYLGSLVVLFMTAFWSVDVFTGEVVRNWGLQNFQTLWDQSVYRVITLRTVGVAAAVTVTDIVLAFPLAYYAARLATPRMRNLVMVLVIVPLWANYLVRVFAWRLILSQGGFYGWFFGLFGVRAPTIANTDWAVWLTFTYLWLPFVMLPIYGSLERVPNSLLEASGDLGAKGWLTFRRVIVPLTIPGIVAGSIFSFSLTLGDYIAPSLVGNSQFIGTVIYANVGVANNLPLAAAYAMVPVAIMAVYLALAKRVGAFEAL
jgi:putative spermidine/putrescine transport system permease protein